MPTAELTIDSIATGGDGVGRTEGLVVFVPRTAPGDVAQVTYEPRGRFARGRVLALRTASPLRVEPACPHYDGDRCGGCQLQHLSYAAQLDAKAAIVRDAVERIAHRPTAAPPVRPSDPWRYRRKLTLALRARGRGWLAGLHPYDDPAGVFALRECPITADRVVALWRAVLAVGEALPRAATLRGAIRIDDAGAASLVIEGGSAWAEPERLLERVAALDAIWWEPHGAGEVRCVAARRTAAAASPAAAFAQVNAAVAAQLQAHVVARALAYEPEHVIDAYAGTGDTAVALAAPARRVTAIELDAAASAWCAQRLPAGSRAVAARVEDVLADLLPADVVIVNPPRAGLDGRVTACLAAAVPAPRAIIYVSCDPATLARDLGRLAAWRIASLVCFDMFPQTAHVETVCELVPEAA